MIIDLEERLYPVLFNCANYEERESGVGARIGPFCTTVAYLHSDCRDSSGGGNSGACSVFVAWKHEDPALVG